MTYSILTIIGCWNPNIPRYSVNLGTNPSRPLNTMEARRQAGMFEQREEREACAPQTKAREYEQRTTKSVVNQWIIESDESEVTSKDKGGAVHKDSRRDA
ncbi:hypothetical protein AAHE18_08G184100 [Arachis hypogaea]|nr:uncharacterized protein DS421_8g245370 [Arachis hypogaea]